MNEETLILDGKELEVGDWVKVANTPGKRDSFKGKIAGWWMDGEICTAIDIWGGKAGYERMRSIRPERVTPIKVKEKK